MKPKTEKLPNKKYLRIHNDQFKEWITALMSEERMKYANAQDVANEIEKVYGGVASSHMLKIRQLRINVQEFKPENKK